MINLVKTRDVIAVYFAVALVLFGCNKATTFVGKWYASPKMIEEKKRIAKLTGEKILMDDKFDSSPLLIIEENMHGNLFTIPVRIVKVTDTKLEISALESEGAPALEMLFGVKSTAQNPILFTLQPSGELSAKLGPGNVLELSHRPSK